MQEKTKNAERQKQIKNIQLNVIKYQLSNFCKRNSKALALIFKALLKGEKITPQDKSKKTFQSTPKLSSKSQKPNPKPTQESTLHLKELDLDIPIPKSPLNIEG